MLRNKVIPAIALGRPAATPVLCCSVFLICPSNCSRDALISRSLRPDEQLLVTEMTEVFSILKEFAHAASSKQAAQSKSGLNFVRTPAAVARSTMSPDVLSPRQAVVPELPAGHPMVEDGASEIVCPFAAIAASIEAYEASKVSGDVSSQAKSQGFSKKKEEVQAEFTPHTFTRGIPEDKALVVSTSRQTQYQVLFGKLPSRSDFSCLCLLAQQF